MEGNQAQANQPVNLPSPEAPVAEIPVPHEVPQKKSKVNVVLGLLFLVLLLLVAYLYYQNAQLKKEIQMLAMSNIVTDGKTSPTPTAHSVSTSDRCKLTSDPGDCEAAIPSYYFDQASGACTEFMWGGCGGSRPFTSLSECQTACVPAADPTADWETYLSTAIGYSVKLPPGWSSTGDPAIHPEVDSYISNSGDRIEVVLSLLAPEECRGGSCGVVATSSMTTVAGLPATKYEGYFGEIAGDFPHQYVSYSFKKSDQYLNITLHASTKDVVDTYEIIELQSDAIELFDNILSTFEFTE